MRNQDKKPSKHISIHSLSKHIYVAVTILTYFVDIMRENSFYTKIYLHLNYLYQIHTQLSENYQFIVKNYVDHDEKFDFILFICKEEEVLKIIYIGLVLKLLQQIFDEL